MSRHLPLTYQHLSSYFWEAPLVKAMSPRRCHVPNSQTMRRRLHWSFTNRFVLFYLRALFVDVLNVDVPCSSRSSCESSLLIALWKLSFPANLRFHCSLWSSLYGVKHPLLQFGIALHSLCSSWWFSFSITPMLLINQGMVFLQASGPLVEVDQLYPRKLPRSSLHSRFEVEYMSTHIMLPFALQELLLSIRSTGRLRSLARAATSTRRQWSVTRRRWDSLILKSAGVLRLSEPSAPTKVCDFSC
jgi:hypothetical protein